jgi:hypothetical protein
MKTLKIGLAVALALGGAAEASAFTPRLPNCGSSYYGSKIKPVRWDRGCTGSWDLTRGRWSHWGRAIAYGRGKTSDGRQVRIRASRFRECDTMDSLGGFYTRVWIKVGAQRDRAYGLHCA